MKRSDLRQKSEEEMGAIIKDSKAPRITGVGDKVVQAFIASAMEQFARAHGLNPERGLVVATKIDPKNNGGHESEIDEKYKVAVSWSRRRKDPHAEATGVTIRAAFEAALNGSHHSKISSRRKHENLQSKVRSAEGAIVKELDDNQTVPVGDGVDVPVEPVKGKRGKRNGRHAQPEATL